MVVEGIRSMELRSTIMANRQRAEAHFTGEESMLDCLSAFPNAFMNQEDLGQCARNCYEYVGKKLLRTQETNFSRLENFVLGSILKHCPMAFAMAVAEFRQENLLTYLTQDILGAEFVKKQLEIFPASRDKLVAMRQRIMIKEIERAKIREAESMAEQEQNSDNYVQETMNISFASEKAMA